MIANERETLSNGTILERVPYRIAVRLLKLHFYASSTLVKEKDPISC